MNERFNQLWQKAMAERLSPDDYLELFNLILDTPEGEGRCFVCRIRHEQGRVLLPTGLCILHSLFALSRRQEAREL